MGAGEGRGIRIRVFAKPIRTKCYVTESTSCVFAHRSVPCVIAVDRTNGCQKEAATHTPKVDALPQRYRARFARAERLFGEKGSGKKKNIEHQSQDRQDTSGNDNNGAIAAPNDVDRL